MDKSPSTLTGDSQEVYGTMMDVPNCNNSESVYLSVTYTLYRDPFGIARTNVSVAKTFVWHGLNRDVKAYVLTCNTCQRSKSSHLRPVGKLMPPPISLWR